MISQLKLGEIGENPTFEEARKIETAPVYAYLLRHSLIYEYFIFLNTVTDEIESIAKDPEYWKKRESHGGDNTDSERTPTESQGTIYEKNLLSSFPDFEKHSPVLKEKGYYEVNDTNLSWKHGGNFVLAVYFGKIQDKPGCTRLMWGDIERAFNTRNLTQYYKDFEPLKRGKTGKHDTHVKFLIDLISGRNRL